MHKHLDAPLGYAEFDAGAAKKAYADILHLVIELGARVHRKDTPLSRQTSLHVAAGWGHADSLQVWLLCRPNHLIWQPLPRLALADHGGHWPSSHVNRFMLHAMLIDCY